MANRDGHKSSYKHYPKDVINKSASELRRMGYSSDEIQEIGDAARRGYFIPPTDNTFREYPPQKTNKNKRYRRNRLRIWWIRHRKIVRVILVIVVAYVAMSVWNGVRQDKATRIVNQMSSVDFGYEILVDKGALGYSWLYLIDPEANFREFPLSTDERVGNLVYVYWEFDGGFTKDLRERYGL